MSTSKAEQLLKARTIYDLLCVTSPTAARHVRLLAVALLPEAERRKVRNTRGGMARLARGFLDAQGNSPEERALSAYRALWTCPPEKSL